MTSLSWIANHRSSVLVKTLSCYFTKILVCFLHIMLVDNSSLDLKLIIITSTPPLGEYQCSLAPLRQYQVICYQWQKLFGRFRGACWRRDGRPARRPVRSRRPFP